MDKHRKLRKYRHKDYSMLVEFPVEIVGRNGVVRTYSFEDAIRLYQRRIGSASSRYDDGEVIEAEITHCRQRILQLRRSYFERYAWASIRSLSRREVAGGEMAAEVAAFLARYAGSVHRAERFGISPVDDAGDANVLYLEPPGRPALLLYLYRFGDGDDCPARQAMETFLGSLEAPVAEGVEHLHASHVTADCGLVLTGTEPPGELNDEVDAVRAEGQLSDLIDPVSRAVMMLRDGRASEAQQLLDSVLFIQPDHRAAALTAALAATHVGVPEQAELYLRLASAYHPDDGILQHHLGIALLQQDRLDEASACFDDALAHQPWLFPSRLISALLALHTGRLDRARELSRGIVDAGGQNQAEAARAVRAMVRRARWRRTGLIGAVLASLVSATWVVLGQPLAIPCFAATVMGSAVLIHLTRRPKPLAIAHEIARRVQVPREILPPSTEDWEVAD